MPRRLAANIWTAATDRVDSDEEEIVQIMNTGFASPFRSLEGLALCADRALVGDGTSSSAVRSGEYLMQRRARTLLRPTIRAAGILASCLFASSAGLAAGPTIEQLKNADYMNGKNAFQGRCSACHTLADSSSNIAGPNLWGVFERVAGSKQDFTYSEALREAGFEWSPERLDAWLADPQGYLPGNIMGIPEAVPAADRVDIISFVMIETGAVDWPRPETAFSSAQADASKPPYERWPSFWNHLMFNTTRYRWVDEGEDFRFDAYFKADGTVATSQEGLEGFWHINDRAFFCYALTGMPVGVGSMVECFPVAAMAIPRFADELWVSNPQGDVKLHGGMVAGRPDWVYGAAAPERAPE